ncbi:MAG TPA: NAD-binding protein [Acidimicrobiales bacterium]
MSTDGGAPWPIRDHTAGPIEGHVIVCGLKGVGLRSVEQLHFSGVQVVVVDEDPDPKLARIVEGWGVRQIHRNANLGDGLGEAGLDRAAAVVCAEANDLATLELALQVHEARPDVRLVVQLANPSVGRALETVTGANSVLDVAALAAPSFIEACLGLATHELKLAGEQFAVIQATVSGDEGYRQTFRSHFGNLAPVAISHADGSDLIICPGRDEPVSTGDRVAVLGTPAEFERSDLDVVRALHLARPSASVILKMRRRIAALMQTNAKGLVLSTSALVALLLLATIVVRFWFVDPTTHSHLDLLTSTYFAVETVATVGFGDYFFGGQSAWIEVMAIIFILCGITLVSTSFALFTNILVSRRIEQSLGRGRVPGLAGHVVVIGLGSVGIRVVEGLVAADCQVVIVEHDPSNRYLDRARSLGVPIVIADATQSQTHVTVNLADASAVAVLTSSDLTNIETGLAVRESLRDRWGDVPVVLRVFDNDLALMMNHNFGFRHVRSTSALAAPWFVGAALGLDVLETFYFEHQPFLVGRLSITPNGGLQGLAMQDLSARTRVIAIQRADSGGILEHPPRRGTRFHEGDEVYILGPYEELFRVLRRDQITASNRTERTTSASPEQTSTAE